MSGTAAGFVAGATAASTLAALETMTGVCLPLGVWGAVGGLWAFWWLDPMTPCRRFFSLAIAALVASVMAKPVAMVLIGAALYFVPWWPKPVDYQLLSWPVALVIGLLCHTVIGRKLIEIAQRAADGVSQ